jgi:hypothetical protein
MGNAFIDFGARAMYKKAFPDCEVFFISSYAKYMSDHIFHNPSFSLFNELEIDYLSIAGCCLNYESLVNDFSDLKTLKDLNPNMKLIFVGAGIWNYEVDVLLSKSVIEGLNPSIFISRDDYSYEVGKETKNAYNGIDCGFFVSDYYKPLETRRKPVVVIDIPENFKIDLKDELMVYTYHEISHEYVEGKSNFSSDVVSDYLTLYANAKRIYTNRVHGGVVGFSYGREVSFLNPNSTKRMSLFDKIGIPNYTGFISPNMDIITEEKEKMVAFLRNHWE